MSADHLTGHIGQSCRVRRCAMIRRDFLIAAPACLVASGLNPFLPEAHAFLPALLARFFFSTGARAAAGLATRGAAGAAGRAAVTAGSAAARTSGATVGAAGAAGAATMAPRVGAAATTGGRAVAVGGAAAGGDAIAGGRLTLSGLKNQAAVTTARSATNTAAVAALKQSDPSLFEKAVSVIGESAVSFALEKGFDIISGNEKNTCSINIQFIDQAVRPDPDGYVRGKYETRIEKENGESLLIIPRRFSASPSELEKILEIPWVIPPLPYTGVVTITTGSTMKCDPLTAIVI